MSWAGPGGARGRPAPCLSKRPEREGGTESVGEEHVTSNGRRV